MTEVVSVAQQSEDIFLALADTVGQSVPAKRLAEYRHTHGLKDNPRYWAIVDFNQPSTQERFYLFDTGQKKVFQYLVAHGKGSEGASDDGMADVFSNVSGSHASSLGIYKCLKEYSGDHGKSLKLKGLEDTNSNAEARKIVLHKANYVSEKFIKDTGRIGRSEGCFVVENAVSDKLVDQLENGSYIIAWKEMN